MNQINLIAATAVFLLSVLGIVVVSRREPRPRDSLKVPMFSETSLVTVLAFVAFIALGFLISFI